MSTETDIEQTTDTTIKYPNRYNVIIHNDDVTPMDFVVQLLVEVFDKDLDDARDVMLTVHHEGAGVAGTYNHEMAEQKLYEAKHAVSMNDMELKLSLDQM